MNNSPSGNTQWNLLYRIGAIMTFLALTGILLDIIIGSITGGDLSQLPNTAAERFGQFSRNCWIGLYNMDLLNIVVQMIMIPAYVAVYAVHRETQRPMALLSLIVFLVGTTIFVTTNTALPMLELSRKFAAASTDEQRTLLAAAGEALLARGAHGSPGVFIGFFIPTLGTLLFSITMLPGRIISPTLAWVGIIGNSLMLLYIIMINFIPDLSNIALAMAMPGGILIMIWMAGFGVKLLRV